MVPFSFSPFLNGNKVDGDLGDWGEKKLKIWAMLARFCCGAAIAVASASEGYAEPNFGSMREIAERAVRARMVDPSSSQFEWPYGFVNGEWKRLFAKRVPGWITCGFVNSRNRMGGYVGRTAFVVVFDDMATMKLLDIGDSSKDFDLVGMGCQKTANSFPSPQPGMFAAETIAEPGAERGMLVADEIAKLGNLRDKGLISDAEFDAQKRKLIGQ